MKSKSQQKKSPADYVPPKHVADDRIIPRRQACREFLACGVSSCYRKEREDPNWPRPHKIGKNRWGYRLSEIQKYIDSLEVRERAAA